MQFFVIWTLQHKFLVSEDAVLYTCNCQCVRVSCCRWIFANDGSFMSPVYVTVCPLLPIRLVP